MWTSIHREWKRGNQELDQSREEGFTTIPLAVCHQICLEAELQSQEEGHPSQGRG